MHLDEEQVVPEQEVTEGNAFEKAAAGGFPGKPRRKSGKKSRFLQKAKKFAKQGRLGRGFEVDTETYNYYVTVLDLCQKNEFETPEDREIFIQNSFTQSEKSEVNLSSNQMVSRVLESLLPSASEEVLIRFTSAFTPALRVICSDPFASHVLEKLLEVTSCDKWSDSKPLKDWFRQTCKFVLNNFEDFTFDPYANHVMRKVCQCLSGYVMPSGQHFINPRGHEVKRKPPTEAEAIFGERKNSKKNTQLLKDFFERFLAWPQFYDLFKVELTCGFVQIWLKTVYRVDPEGVQKAVALTMKALGSELTLDNASAINLQTRTLELCLGVADEDSWIKIYRTYFVGKLGLLGAHEKGKFSIKRLIEACPQKNLFEEIFDELEPEFEKLYAAKHNSPFVTLAEGCKKFQTRQKAFLKSLTSMLGYDNETGDADDAPDAEKPKKKKKGVVEEKKENFILYLARFGMDLKLKDDGSKLFITDIHGTMVLQQLLDFHKPHKVVSAILELEGAELSSLTQDPKGSHIIDAFFKSSSIGEKNKEKLLMNLKEYMVPFALNKFGSRVIDVIWSWANIKNKAIVAAALCDRINQLNANQYGKFMSEKCMLRLYKRDPKEWGEAIGQGKKRKQAVEDVVNELELGSPKKKSKKNKNTEEEPEVAEEVMDESIVTQGEDEEDTPKKKKKKSKKNRKSTEAE